MNILRTEHNFSTKNLCFRWHILRSYRLVAEVTFKNNEDTVNAIIKRRIKTSRKALGSRVCFLTVRKTWEGNFLAAWIANFLDICFATNPWNNNNNNNNKNNNKSWRTYSYSSTPPAPKPPIWAKTLLAGPTLPRPIVRTLSIHRTLREDGRRRVTDISMVLDFFPNELLTSG